MHLKCSRTHIFCNACIFVHQPIRFEHFHTQLSVHVSLTFYLCLLLSLASALPVNHTRVAMPTTLADLPDAANHAYIDHVLDDGSSHKLIILVTVNTGYLDFFRNWLHYYRKLGLGMYLVIAEDKAAFQTLYDDPDMNLKGRVLYAGDDERVRGVGKEASLESAFNFRTAGFSAIVNRRPTYLQIILQLGYDVLYTDVDTIWLQDPLPFLSNATIQLYTQADPSNEHEAQEGMACSGFVLMRCTRFVIDFVTQWRLALEDSGDFARVVTNQQTFDSLIQDILLGTNILVENLRFLEFDLFPNGALFFDKEWREKQARRPVIIHNNWIIGHDEKVVRFRELGLWHADKV